MSQYQDILRTVVLGTRRTSPEWPRWFDAENGDLDTRIRAVFQHTGYVPSPSQFDDAVQKLAVLSEEPVVVEEPEELEAQKLSVPKRTKKVEEKE